MTPPPPAEAGPPRFAIQVGGDGADAAAVEEFALALQRELDDLGLSRVERVAAGPAPDGARALEIIGLLGFIITAVDAGQAIGKVVSVVRDLARRFGQRRGGVKVTLGGSDVDLTTAGADEIGRAVATVLGSWRTNEKSARAALVIANAAYRHPSLTRLRAPGVDAAALAGVLGDPKVGGFEVDRLVDADEGTIRRRLAAFFANRDRDDLLLLHFSGHGVKDARGRLYLAAADTDIASLSATAVPASFVNDLIDETQSRRVVLILDCCYSGAFARGASPRADDAVHVNDEFGGTGRVVLTASSATEYSFEGTDLTRDAGRPSVFTGALVQGLASGDADTNHDGEITIDELYDYVYSTVRRQTPHQAPMKWSLGVEGTVTIARSNRVPALPAAIRDDLASDRPVLREEGVRALARLAADGTAGVRAAALARLAEVRDTDDSARVRAAAAAALGTTAPTGRATATAPPPVAAPAPRAPEPATVPRAPEPAAPPGSPEPAARPPRSPEPAAAPPARAAAPQAATARSAPPQAAASQPAAPQAAAPQAAAPQSPPVVEPVTGRAAVRPGVTYNGARDYRLRGRKFALVAAGAACALVAFVLHIVGVYVQANGFPDATELNVFYACVVLAAGAALVMRVRGTALLFAGVTIGFVTLPVPFDNQIMKDTLQGGFNTTMTGLLFGILAAALAVAGALPGRDRAKATGRRVLGFLAIVVPLFVGAYISGYDLSRVVGVAKEDVDQTSIAVAALLAALGPALFVLGSPRNPGLRLFFIGWFVGALLYDLRITAFPDISATNRVVNWAVLIELVVAIAIFTSVTPRPDGPTSPPAGGRQPT